MKISYISDEYGRAGFSASPEEQDGQPRVGFLYTSLAPTWFSGGRRALACALSNLSYVSGRLAVDQKFAPLTANLLRQLMPSTELFIDTSCIDFKPTDIQKGGSVLHVGTFDTLADANLFVQSVSKINGGVRQTALGVLKNDGVRGFLATPSTRIVGSNYWFMRGLSSDTQSFFSLASLALLYSEDLSAERIVLYTDLPIGEETLQVIVDAFYSVGLTLEVRNEK